MPHRSFNRLGVGAGRLILGKQTSAISHIWPAYQLFSDPDYCRDVKTKGQYSKRLSALRVKDPRLSGLRWPKQLPTLHKRVRGSQDNQTIPRVHLQAPRYIRICLVAATQG